MVMWLAYLVGSLVVENDIWSAAFFVAANLWFAADWLNDKRMGK